MDIAEYIMLAIASVGAIIAAYKGFKAGVVQIGKAIPGEDPVERFGDMLGEKVDPIVGLVEAAITKAVDTLNPNTHGGAGNADPK